MDTLRKEIFSPNVAWHFPGRSVIDERDLAKSGRVQTRRTMLHQGSASGNTV
jgi:hypothetical protein